MTKTELISDIEFLLSELPKVHVDLFALISLEKFQALGASIIKQISAESLKEEDFGIALLPLFAALKDTHTKPCRDDDRTPLYFEWVDGGYYPFVIDEQNERLLLERLVGIDGIEIDKYISMLNEFLIFDNDEAKKIEIGRALSDFSMIKYLTQSSSKEMEYRFENGDVIKVSPEGYGNHVAQRSIYGIEGNQFLNTRQNYSVSMKEGSLYLRYARCREDEEYPISTLVEDIEKLLNDHPKKIIIDLRGNQGGSSSVLDPVIDMLIWYLKANNAKVFCLINRRVYSSGVLNAFDLKYELNATLVGQPTSQGVNHYGEIEYFTLPNSKLEIQYSTKYFKIIDVDSTTLEPDIYIEPTVEDYKRGKDRTLEYCLVETH